MDGMVHNSASDRTKPLPAFRKSLNRISGTETKLPTRKWLKQKKLALTYDVKFKKENKLQF